MNIFHDAWVPVGEIGKNERKVPPLGTVIIRSMTSPNRRLVLGAAIAVPLLTAAVCGVILLQAVRPPHPSPASPGANSLAEALDLLQGADARSPEALDQAADAADARAGRRLAESCLSRARAARLRRQPDRERSFLDEALRAAPDRSEIQLARLLLAAEKWAEAAIPRPAIEAPALAIRPENPHPAPPPPELDPSSLKGRAADVAGLLVAVIVGRDPAEKHAAATREGMEDRLQFALGVAALRRGRLEAAAAWLRGAAEKDPTPPRWRALALASLKNGNAAAVDEACRRWREADPKDPDPGLYEALAKSASGDLPGALAALDGSVATAPTHRTLRGWAAYLAGRSDRAREDAEALAASDPTAMLLRGILRLAGGDPAGALADAQASGSGYASLCLKAEAQAALGRSEEAVAAWKEAVRTDGARPAARLGLADHLVAKGRLDEALAELEELPDHPHARRRRISVLVTKGDHAEALRAAESAVARFPGEARLRLELGRVRHVRGDHYGELQAYAQAIELDPSNTEARNLHAECLKELTPK